MALALAWLGRLTCGARAKSRGCENTPFRELKQGCLLRGMAVGGGGRKPESYLETCFLPPVSVRLWRQLRFLDHPEGCVHVTESPLESEVGWFDGVLELSRVEQSITHHDSVWLPCDQVYSFQDKRIWGSSPPHAREPGILMVPICTSSVGRLVRNRRQAKLRHTETQARTKPF